MRFRNHGKVLITAAFLAGGCGDATGGGGTAVSRDSAGIAIVENSGPAWPADKGWTVADSPFVDIGGGSGGIATEELDRVLGPVRLSDGRFAIADAGSNQVRIFDSAGKRLHVSGRAGSGPGEFQNIVGIWVGPGDSLMVFDVLARRLSILDRDAAFGRTLSLGGGSGFVAIGGQVDFAIPQGWFADGSIVGISQTFSLNQPRQGIYRDSITMIRYGPDGAVRDTLSRFPGTETEQMTTRIGGQSIPTPMPVPLGRQSVTLVEKDRFYVTENNSWEIEVRGLDGALRRLVRARVPASPITPEDAAAHRKEQLDQMEALPMMKNIPAALKEQLRARIEQANYPATRPFFSLLVADPAGNIWAREVAAPGDKTQHFAVVDSSGVFLGRVTMPTGFRLSSVGADAVYGVWKDLDDMEHVRVYRLTRAP